MSARRDRGSVLVLAMVVLVAITFIALNLARDARVEVQVAARAVDDARTRSLADSCIETMICMLKLDLQADTATSTVGDTIQKQWRDDENDLRNFPLGDGHCWIFFGEEDVGDGRPAKYGIRDEASKLNVNTATYGQLMQIPLMTDALADAIIDWRNTSTTKPTANGAESDYYNSLLPLGYGAKNAPIETIEEMLCIKSADGEFIDESILYGEDRNRNGILDPCEDDGPASFPPDNQDGILQLGFADYLTTCSADLDVTWDGRLRMQLKGANPADVQTRLTTYGCSSKNAQEVATTIRRAGAQGVQSIGQFVTINGMTEADLAVIGDELTVHAPATAGQLGQIPGRINVNTAANEVLAGLGMGSSTNLNPVLSANDVTAIMNARLSPSDDMWSPAWLLNVITARKLATIWDEITCRSWQFTIQAVVALDQPTYLRPMRRIEAVIDRSYIPIKILWRRDTTYLGFPIGNQERGPDIPW